MVQEKHPDRKGAEHSGMDFVDGALVLFADPGRAAPLDAPCNRGGFRWVGLPELNPVEQIWSNLKGQKLANVPAEGLGQVIARAAAELPRHRRCTPGRR